MPDFGERLKTLRKKAGLNQTQLAESVGVSLLTLFRWEKGERQPRLEDIKTLAKALNVPESELLNDPPPQPDGWVLTVKMSNNNEEVIDLTAPNVQVVSTVLNKPDGGWLCLGGDYSLWEDDAGFNKIIRDLKKLRELVIAGGISYGKLSPKETKGRRKN